MSAGDEKIIADRIYAALSNAPRPTPPAPVRAPATDLTGAWDVNITYLASASRHTLHLRQSGNKSQARTGGQFAAVKRDIICLYLCCARCIRTRCPNVTRGFDLCEGNTRRSIKTR